MIDAACHRRNFFLISVINLDLMWCHLSAWRCFNAPAAGYQRGSRRTKKSPFQTAFSRDQDELSSLKVELLHHFQSEPQCTGILIFACARAANDLRRRQGHKKPLFLLQNVKVYRYQARLPGDISFYTHQAPRRKSETAAEG